MPETIAVNGVPLDFKERTFSTGSRGYYAFGKVVLDGKKYQVMANLVEIGSKKAKKRKAKK